MSLAGSAGSGSKDVSFKTHMNESAGRVPSVLVSNKLRHLEDVESGEMAFLNHFSSSQCFRYTHERTPDGSSWLPCMENTGIATLMSLSS